MEKTFTSGGRHGVPRFFVALLPLLVLLVGLAGCKPTENNYRAAYDAALGKRQSAEADKDLRGDGHQVISLDGPQRVKSSPEEGAVEVWLDRQRLKPIGEGAPEPRPRYLVAVGVYSMGANAAALTERLRKDGLQAYPARAKDDRIWVVVPGGGTLAEAAATVEGLKGRYPEMPWTGLPGEPVVVE